MSADIEMRNRMYNYKMKIEYDGGRYDGWQRMGKDESNNTVSFKIMEVLKKMVGEEIELFCGCRTEKGVHAYAQIVNFKLSKKEKSYEIKNYLNRYLPHDIAILELEEAEERFHSQLNAKNRTYIYRIDCNDIADVFERKYKYHCFDKLDVEAMREAAKKFIGSHDYKEFSTARRSKSTVKCVNKVEICDEENEIEIIITANDFLHNMARFMIGLLIEIGKGSRKGADIEKLLSGDGSVQICPPAESYALFLQSIEY